jgi:hypothetical protein
MRQLFCGKEAHAICLAQSMGKRRMAIPPDSTVESIFHTLVRPLDYVPTAYGKLNAGNRIHPPAVIRIGCMGDGKFPNYRIEHSTGLMGPFNGQTHGPLANADNAQEENWSQKSMTFDELRLLLQQLRAGIL